MGLYHKWGLALTMILVIHLVLGCGASPSKQIYEDAEFGIRLEAPRNWSIESYKRNGSIVLETKEGLFAKDSARVEIYGIACVIPPWPIDHEEVIAGQINRIETLYSLDSAIILQPPNKVEHKDYRIYTATIQIPTISMPEDSPRNQLGIRDSNTLQTIELYSIKDESNNGIWIEVYTGNNVQLNDQAQEIVNSIVLTCGP